MKIPTEYFNECLVVKQAHLIRVTYPRLVSSYKDVGKNKFLQQSLAPFLRCQKEEISCLGIANGN